MARRSHLYKRAEAIGHAHGASAYLREAIRNLQAAERQLELSGYRGAARGVHQANERVKAWMEKVSAEVKA